MVCTPGTEAKGTTQGRGRELHRVKIYEKSTSTFEFSCEADRATVAIGAGTRQG